MTDKILFDEYYENFNNPNESNVKLNNQNPNRDDHASYPQGQPWHMNEVPLHQHNEQMPYQDDYVYPEGDRQPPYVPPQDMQHAHPSSAPVQNEQNPDNQAFEHGLTPDPSQYQSAISPITQEADSFPNKENTKVSQEEAVTHSKTSQSNNTSKKSKKAQNTCNQKPRKTKKSENILTLEQEKIVPHLITTYHAALASLLKEYDISQENLLFRKKHIDMNNHEMLLYLHTHMPIVLKITKEGKPAYYELVAGIRWKGIYDFLIYNGIINKDKEFTASVITKEKNSTAINDYIKDSLIWEIRERLKRKEEQPNGRDDRTNVGNHLKSVLESLCKNSPKS